MLEDINEMMKFFSFPFLFNPLEKFPPSPHLSQPIGNNCVCCLCLIVCVCVMSCDGERDESNSTCTVCRRSDQIKEGKKEDRERNSQEEKKVVLLFCHNNLGFFADLFLVRFQKNKKTFCFLKKREDYFLLLFK